MADFYNINCLSKVKFKKFKNSRHITKDCGRPPYCKMAPSKMAAKQPSNSLVVKAKRVKRHVIWVTYQSRPYEYQLGVGVEDIDPAAVLVYIFKLIRSFAYQSRTMNIS